MFVKLMDRCYDDVFFPIERKLCVSREVLSPIDLLVQLLDSSRSFGSVSALVSYVVVVSLVFDCCM